MITTAQDIIEKFGQPPINEKQKVVSAILRESLEVEPPSLTDEELVLNAEEIFLELDQRETENGKS